MLVVLKRTKSIDPQLEQSGGTRFGKKGRKRRRWKGGVIELLRPPIRSWR
jgi:hypothetical protein